MIFWPIFVTGLFVLAVFLSGGLPTDLLDPGQDETMRVYAVVFGLGLIFGVGSRVAFRAGARTLLVGAVWSILITALVGFLGFKDQMIELADRLQSKPASSMAITQLNGEAELSRGWDGHFRADIIINGAPVRMMVDTGASVVLVPYELVTEIGLDPTRLRYSMPVTTANGRSTVAPIRLDSVRIGTIVVNDVDAAVAHPGKLRTGLLGMSFLDRLAETSFRGDKLILRQSRDGADGGFQSAPVPAPTGG